MKNIMIWIILLLSTTYVDAQNEKSPRKDYAKLANYDESKVPQYTFRINVPRRRNGSN